MQTHAIQANQPPDINPQLSTEPKEISTAEQEINRYLTFSSVGLALSSVGAFFAPLTVLSIPFIITGNVPFWQQTYQSLFKKRQIDAALIDFISVAGSIVTGHLFAAALANAFSNFSRKLLVKTEDHSRQSLINVFGEQPRFVWIQKENPHGHGETIEVEVSVDTLAIGDTVVVDAGQMIPIDGKIMNGVGTIDQRALTGESQPVEKVMGDDVLASTILLSGRLYIQVEKTGEDTVAAHIGGILNSTDDFKSSILSRGQKIVDQGAIPTLALSLLALPILGVQSALTMLYASFGYHMKIAAPISVLNFLRITSESGILVKDGRCLELLSEIDTVVFDKTGTLTEDVPTVGKIYTASGQTEDTILGYAAAAEQKQTHPIAHAILKEATERGYTFPVASDAEYEMGYGLKVMLTNESGRPHVVRVGSGRFMAMCDITVPGTYHQIEARCHAEGYSLIYIAIDEQLGGAIELVPTIRPESYEIINELRRRNITTYIISGDHQTPTAKLAQTLGVDRFFAEVLPQDKANIIEQLQNEGKSVCFVGDGINDSIALKTAHIGISMSGASMVATDTAGIILMDGTLAQFIRLLDIANQLDGNLSRSTMITVVPGIVCAFGVFFLNFGLVTGVMLYNLTLFASVSNALMPLLKHNREKKLNAAHSPQLTQRKPLSLSPTFSSLPTRAGVAGIWQRLRTHRRISKPKLVTALIQPVS
ncbi:MAG: heavy metal translocating P-type ATPase [Chloroflexota bacterium]